MPKKLILCVDFDGVIHSYKRGWMGPTAIPDPPVDGAIEFLVKAIDYFDVQIYSSRSAHEGGIEAMQEWLADHWARHYNDPPVDFLSIVQTDIGWPTEKPPAFVTLDDRAITFNGYWPSMNTLLTFKPWNKK